MAKEKPWQATAIALFDGDGTPRYREGIIEAIRAALEYAEEHGRQLGAQEARERVLREALAIAEGAEQAAHSRRVSMARELEQHLAGARKSKS